MNITTDLQGNPILDQFSEEGFIDCVFCIKDLVKEQDSYRFHMAASFADETVGVDVVLVHGIQAGFTADMELDADHVYRQGVRFLRSGPESDRLIRAIATLYGADNASHARMVESETYTAIALHQGDIDMETEPVKLKIFGKDDESDSEDDYYESFFNVDLANGFIFWNEKDQEYREPLLRALIAV